MTVESNIYLCVVVVVVTRVSSVGQFVGERCAGGKTVDVRERVAGGRYLLRATFLPVPPCAFVARWLSRRCRVVVARGGG